MNVPLNRITRLSILSCLFWYQDRWTTGAFGVMDYFLLIQKSFYQVVVDKVDDLKSLSRAEPDNLLAWIYSGRVLWVESCQQHHEADIFRKIPISEMLSDTLDPRRIRKPPGRMPFFHNEAKLVRRSSIFVSCTDKE